MLVNYIKVIFRNLYKQKTYAFINISGLAIGFSFCLLIFLYAQNELSYDRFHARSDRIYRLLYGQYAEAPAPIAALLQENFVEIEQTVRVVQGPRHPVRYGEKNFYEERFFLADAAFFEIFDFELLRGNAATVLTRPFSLVLTEKAAAKYFGEDDPVGKTLLVNNTHEYVITGIVQNPPVTSHFKFDFLASYATLDFSIYNTPQYKTYSGPDLEWRRYATTYLLLKPDQKPEPFEKKLADFADVHLKERLRGKASLHLQALTDIHLFSVGLKGEIQPQGDSRALYFISSIGLLILLIACINYVNLATARSASRGLEVGVRKVIGARKGQLIRQFLGESALFCVLALGLAFALAELLLPAFNAFLDVQLDLSNLWKGRLPLILPGFVLLVSLVAGAYPAFFLSSFEPARVLKGNATLQARRLVRQGLVFFQFCVTAILICCTLVVQRQLDYIRKKPLGFDKENVVVISTWVADKKQNVTLKHALLQQASISHVTLGVSIPGKSQGGISLTSKNIADLPENQRIGVQTYGMDGDFIETLGLELIAGRDFDPKLDKPDRVVILNEALVQALGWHQPLGKRMNIFGAYAEVIGVVKNFHSQSLREQFEPAIITLPRLEGRFDLYMAVRILPGALREALGAIKSAWKEFNPHLPLQYSFLDKDIEALYRTEMRLGKILQTFTILAIVIACLGLFGLTAYAAERRTKEIGIRKVLGATMVNVVALLSKDFVKLVLLANLIAWPVAWFAMNKWLQNFAYRIDIGWWVFVLAGGLALVIALLTVSTQAIRAAVANPVESLRYE